MNVREPVLPQVHLKPGELLVTRDPCLVVTVLGSCLAVTMYNARLRLAAICHAMLPRPKATGSPEAGAARRFKYLSEVIPAMTGRFLTAGVSPTEVEVKLFGGGNLITTGDATPSGNWLGSVNVETARELLDREAFLIKAANVGGKRGRKIVFNTRTGEVLHKHLPASARGLHP